MPHRREALALGQRGADALRGAVGSDERRVVLLEEYEDKLTGRRQARLRVPYLGYESLTGNGSG